MKLYGKNPIIERIRKNPGSIKKLFLQKRTDLSNVVKAVKEAGLTFESLEKKAFDRLAGNVNSQGVFAEVDNFQYASFEGLIEKCKDKKSIPVFLDGIKDPQNLGSIIRTLACIGGFSIVLPEHSSCGVNETVLRVASGGENYIPISRVTNIATAIKNIQKHGVKVFGSALDGERTALSKLLPKGPIALVIGSEGKGMRPGVKKILNGVISLEMDGADLSYNASIATAILCYEVKKMR